MGHFGSSVTENSPVLVKKCRSRHMRTWAADFMAPAGEFQPNSLGCFLDRNRGRICDKKVEVKPQGRPSLAGS